MILFLLYMAAGLFTYTRIKARIGEQDHHIFRRCQVDEDRDDEGLTTFFGSVFWPAYWLIRFFESEMKGKDK